MRTRKVIKRIEKVNIPSGWERHVDDWESLPAYWSEFPGFSGEILFDEFNNSYIFNSSAIQIGTRNIRDYNALLSGLKFYRELNRALRGHK